LATLLVGACSAPLPPAENERVQPVTVIAVAPRAFKPRLAAFGVVQPAASAELVVPFAGEVRYPARFRDGLRTGATVAAGQALAELSDGDSGRAVVEARLRAEAAQAEYERFLRAAEAGVVSEATLTGYRLATELAASGLAAAEAQQKRQTLTAPVSGVLADVRELPPGTHVLAGTVLARVLATGSGWVEAWVAASDRPALTESQRVILRGPSSGQVSEGKVRDVAPTVKAGALWVRIEVADAAKLPSPGEGVEVSLELRERPSALLVPVEVVVMGGGYSAVFVTERQTEGPVAHRRQVVLGGRRDGWVEVLEGLRGGDRVVVDGVAFLAEGDRVREVAAERLQVPPWESTADGETAPP